MKNIKWLAIGTAACLFLSFRASADILYNNGVNNSGYTLTLQNGQEAGNEILMTGSYYLTNFSFNYYSSGSDYGDVTLEILFQINNGTPYNGYNTPGTVIYDSGPFSLPNNNGDGGLDFSINDLSLGDTVPLNSNTPLPSDFTVSYIVQGLTEDDVFGLDLYDPPAGGTPGSSYNDYWYNPGTGWILDTNNVAPSDNDIASIFYGSLTPAPEPATISIGILSGAALLLMAKRRRQ